MLARRQLGPTPFVRLSKLERADVLAVEILRVLDRSGGGVSVYVPEVLRELARRGVVTGPDETSSRRVWRACSRLETLGLLVKKPGFKIVQITRDGRDTLRDWDDPTADCVPLLEDQ